MFALEEFSEFLPVYGVSTIRRVMDRPFGDLLPTIYGQLGASLR